MGPKKWPETVYLKWFGTLNVFLVWKGGGRKEEGGADARTDARTHARTPARRPTPLHNAHRKKIRRSGHTPSLRYIYIYKYIHIMYIYICMYIVYIPLKGYIHIYIYT